MAEYDRLQRLMIWHIPGKTPISAKVLRMSSETITREKKVQNDAPEQVAPAKPQLDGVLDQVRRDSHSEAGEYLHESTVPHGGE